VRPAAVEGGLAGVGAGGHSFHGEAGVAEGPQQVEDGVVDRLLEGDAPAAVQRGLAWLLGRLLST